MKLKYVGHKPIISAKGVDFSIGKEDKYIFIEPAAQMLIFLDKLEMDSSIHINPNKRLDETEVLKILYKYRPDFDKFFDKKISAYKKDIDDEISEVDKQNHLIDIEKEVLKNNLEYMKEYRIQRAINKLVYEELINASVDLIRKKGVKEIKMPFSLPFVHVAESFESSLALLSKAVVAKVEVMLDRGEPYTKLSIKGFGNI